MSNFGNLWLMDRPKNWITAYTYRNLPFKPKLPLSTCKPDNFFSIHTTGIYAITDNGDNDNICVKINELCVKILRVLVRENNIQYVKFFQKVPVKKIIQYVKSLWKVCVKISYCPWIFLENCAWKIVSLREKSQKKVKKRFHALLLFSRRKKNTAQIQGSREFRWCLRVSVFFNIFK